jgi:simple sugar transport system permease protein
VLADVMTATRRSFVTAVPIITRQIILILFSFLIGGVVLLLANYNPIDVAGSLWRGITTDFGGVLRWSTPMILTGLAAAVAFRAQVWNIGIDGQLFLGAFAAAWIGLEFPELSSFIAVPAAFALSITVGVLWALLAGWLKVRFGTNEIVSTLMLNFIAFLITDWLVLGPYADTGPSSNTFSTARISENIYIGRIMQGAQANVGLYIAIVLAVVIGILMYRTTVGYELKVVGSNPWFAQYGGIRIRRVILLAVGISGGIAGLTGAIEMMGVHRRFAGRFSTGLGFDGIVVAILARNHPIGVLAAGFFFGALRNGAANMQRIANVPREMVEIIQAIIILVVSADFVIDFYRKRRKNEPDSTPDSAAPSIEASSSQESA